MGAEPQVVRSQHGALHPPHPAPLLPCPPSCAHSWDKGSCANLAQIFADLFEKGVFINVNFKEVTSKVVGPKGETRGHKACPHRQRHEQGWGSETGSGGADEVAWGGWVHLLPLGSWDGRVLAPDAAAGTR